jgi:hypothetical protein
MGDRFQILVDLDATPEDAAELAARGLAWLVAEGIVSADKTDCVLGAPLGNPPGAHWAKAVTDPDWELGGGLNIEIGRTQFWGGPEYAQYAVCPQCTERTWFYTDSWEWVDGASTPFEAATEAWLETGEAAATCPHCAQDSDLTAWQWAEGSFAFGCLGFEFWHWQDFDPRFLADLGHALGGHRVVCVWGKF